MEAVLAEVGRALEAEGDRREAIKASVKDLESITRNLQGSVQRCFSRVPEAPAVCTASLAQFGQCAPHFAALAKVFPAEEYFKYNDHWRFVCQNLCGLACFVVWVTERRLASIEDVERLCGVVRPQFRIELEDYLVGVTGLPAELSRLATNAVTHGRYNICREIRDFVADLYNSFRLLNLKNDILRKRYDGIKYELKKMEEIVYDITVRNLVDAPQ